MHERTSSSQSRCVRCCSTAAHRNHVDRVRQSPTEYYKVLQSTTDYYSVLQEYYGVLQSHTHTPNHNNHGPFNSDHNSKDRFGSPESRAHHNHGLTTTRTTITGSPESRSHHNCLARSNLQNSVSQYIHIYIYTNTNQMTSNIDNF